MAIHTFPETPALFDAASAAMADEIQDVSRRKDRILVAVCGGRSVAEIFRRLLQIPEFPTEKLHIFMADERVVAVNHPDWNGALIEEEWIKPMVERHHLARSQWHPFIPDETLPDFGAASYTAELLSAGPRLDLVLLSMGEDGHVASLFPGHGHGSDRIGYLPVTDSPKPPPRRISLSAQGVMSAGCSILLATGAAKNEAFQRFQKPGSEKACPARYALSATRSHVFVDQGANPDAPNH